MRATCIACLALLAASGVHGAASAETFRYSDGDTEMTGYLALPADAEAPRPGVLIVHEWWGLGDHVRKTADRLAASGHAALAVDMYGEGRTTEQIPEAAAWSDAVKKDPALARSRFEAALAAFRDLDAVDGARVAAIGYCFGGTIALDMARFGVDLAGVVSFHGGLGTATEASETPIAAKVLVLHGADDPLVPEDEVRTFQEEMRTRGADWQFIAYGGAVHSFTNPEVDRHGLDAARYHSGADRRSWLHMKTFLKELFAEGEEE